MFADSGNVVDDRSSFTAARPRRIFTAFPMPDRYKNYPAGFAAARGQEEE
jgi:hypothetical protein